MFEPAEGAAELLAALGMSLPTPPSAPPTPWQCISVQKFSDYHNRTVTSIVELSNGTILTSGADGRVCHWSTKTRARLNFIVGCSSVGNTMIELDKNLFVCSGKTSRLILWDMASDNCIQTQSTISQARSLLKLQRKPVPHLHLVSGMSDGSLIVWNVIANKEFKYLHHYQAHGDQVGVFCLCELEDGRVVSGSSDRLIKISDVMLRRCDKTLRGHDNCVSSVIELKAKKMIASYCVMGVIRVWRIDSGDCIREIVGSPQLFSDGLTEIACGVLAFCSSNEKLEIYDIETQERCQLPVRGASISALRELRRYGGKKNKKKKKEKRGKGKGREGGERLKPFESLLVLGNSQGELQLVRLNYNHATLRDWCCRAIAKLGYSLQSLKTMIPSELYEKIAWLSDHN